jgi:hypothetical protein
MAIKKKRIRDEIVRKLQKRMYKLADEIATRQYENELFKNELKKKIK